MIIPYSPFVFVTLCFVDAPKKGPKNTCLHAFRRWAGSFVKISSVRCRWVRQGHTQAQRISTISSARQQKRQRYKPQQVFQGRGRRPGRNARAGRREMGTSASPSSPLLMLSSLLLSLLALSSTTSSSSTCFLLRPPPRPRPRPRLASAARNVRCSGRYALFYIISVGHGASCSASLGLARFKLGRPWQAVDHKSLTHHSRAAGFPAHPPLRSPPNRLKTV